MAKTAYLFDEIYMTHDTGWGHPEKPARLEAINKVISSASYYKDLIKVGPSMPDFKHIEAIHAKSYIQRVEKEIASGISYLDSMDTAVCKESYDVALKAVGGSLSLCDLIMNGKAVNGFCAVRPPGHHAEETFAAGFCIFNNIAIAARYLQSQFKIKNIAIIDWDVHHGNGTQHSFESDNTIYYISTHQYPHYPGTGAAHERGKGKGEGFTLNIPMRAGSGDEEYLSVFNEQIIPELDTFKPEVVLISAGFDAHRSDPLSSINLSTETFHTFTKLLMDAAERHSKNRVAIFLEGGYNLDALSKSVGRMMDALAGN